MRRLRATQSTGTWLRILVLPRYGTLRLNIALPRSSVRFQGTVTATQYPQGTTFQCSLCGKGFRLVNALSHHIMTKHAGDAKVVALGPDGKPLANDAKATNCNTTTTENKPPSTEVKREESPATPSVKSDATKDVQQTQDAPPVPSEPASPDGESSSVATAADGRVFTCTVCEKQFRLEAALVHHYQAKHGMEPPASTVNPKKPRSESGDNDAAAADDPGVPKPIETNQSSRGHSYIASSETVVPQPPQYHLDVAPNAPEEAEIAAHHRCVNHMLLVGTTQDVQQGYVFEDAVTQFILVTDFEGFAPGEPDRDFHTVRVYGAAKSLEAKKMLEANVAGNGKRVLVSGRLRIVPQFESKTGKYYHFPVVQVTEGTGFIHVLDG